MHKVGDVAMAIVAVAAIFVVTRPGSQAADVVRSITGGFAGLIGAATGQSAARPAAPRRRPRAR